MAKQVSPGVLALRKVVDDVYADAREAKKQGKLVGWSSSKFPCELAEAFDLNVMYPENQAAGIAAQRDGEIMCQAAEDLGFDNDICGYARISLAYAAGKRASRKFDPETLEFIMTRTAVSPSRTRTARSLSILRPASPRRTPRRRSPTRFWTISTRSRLCPRPPRRRSPTRTSAARPSSPTSRCASPSRTLSCAATTFATA